MEKSGMEEKISRTAGVVPSTSAAQAVVATPSANHHALDRRLANQATLAFSPVDTMLQLEKPFFTVGVNIIRN